MATIKRFSRGDLILLTSGEHSDYGVIGTVMALRDFTSWDVRVLALANAPTCDSSDRVDIAQVLSDAGYVKEVSIGDLHHDDWGDDDHQWPWKDRQKP